MKVLVTGAGGYIGTTLVPMLLDGGHTVIALDRYFFGPGLLAEHPNLVIVKEDNRFLAEEHMVGVEAVIDLATRPSGPRAPVAYGSLHPTPATTFLHHSKGHRPRTPYSPWRTENSAWSR